MRPPPQATDAKGYWEVSASVEVLRESETNAAIVVRVLFYVDGCTLSRSKSGVSMKN